MKPTRSWILIADGAHARVLEQVGRGAALVEVAGVRRSIVLPRSRDLGDDKPGRAEQMLGGPRSAMEPRTDPHRELKRKLAHEVADMLAGMLAEKAFDKLVIVAPPTTLGDVRAALSAPVRAVVAGEVTADLTKTPDHEVAGHLRDVIF